MQLNFDSRSQLSKGSRLALYLDAACTQQIMCCEGDDLATCESLWVPAECVWLHYQCEQNQTSSWGFKIRATTLRWRARNEALALLLPYENAWDLLQLLAEEAPEEILRPAVLGNLLRYLQHGRAPHKERVCSVLLEVLSMPFELERVQFDWCAFSSLELQIAWHEVLSSQQQGGVLLLPSGTQSMLDLLVLVRTLMQEAGLSLWDTSLQCMDEVSELSALSKWLLHPDDAPRPAQSLRLALRAANMTDFEGHMFSKWSLATDEQLVEYVDRGVQNGGSSPLNLRGAQLVSIRDDSHAFAELAATTPSARCLRFYLLQRFNQLLYKNLPLVHTASGGLQPHTLGGRLCLLRGLIFFDAKLGFLQQALGATTVDADAPSVLLNRLRAAKYRADPHAA